MLRPFRLVLAAALLCLPLAARSQEKDDQLPGKKLPDKAKTVLDKAETIEVYSLDPGDNNDPKGFHGWKVLGKTAVKDAAKRTELLGALEQGLAESQGGAKCFIPRHGVRATYDGQTVDLVICFECSWVYVYYGDKDGPHLTTSKSPQPAFDKVLKDAGVPLPKN